MKRLLIVLMALSLVPVAVPFAAADYGVRDYQNSCESYGDRCERERFEREQRRKGEMRARQR